MSSRQSAHAPIVFLTNPQKNTDRKDDTKYETPENEECRPMCSDDTKRTLRPSNRSYRCDTRLYHHHYHHEDYYHDDVSERRIGSSRTGFRHNSAIVIGSNVCEARFGLNPRVDVSGAVVPQHSAILNRRVDFARLVPVAKKQRGALGYYM